MNTAYGFKPYIPNVSEPKNLRVVYTLKNNVTETSVRLMKKGNLWFFPDGLTYCGYTPQFWL